MKRVSIYKAIRTSVLFLFITLLQNLNAQNTTFLPPRYWTAEGENYYINNKNVVHDHIDPNKDLYYFPRNGAIVHVSANTVLSFIADPSWSRIVYGKYGGNWVKSYGGYGSGSGQFRHPASVATDGLGNIYVADTQNGRIVTLWYNATNNEIDPGSFASLGEGILQRPWDLDVDDMGNLDPSDDVIWVVDNDAGQIVPFNPDGSLWQDNTITSLFSGNTVYNDLTGVSGIAIRKNQGVNSIEEARIYMVDWKQRKLFLVEANSSCSSCHSSGGAEYVYMEKTFANDVVLSGVESDYFGDVWVVDNANGKVYKYTWDGQYLDALTGLNNPTSVASVRRHHLNMAITEQWTNTTGNRTYSHGANIRDLTISAGTSVANFDFRLTNYCSLEAKIYKGGNLVATLENGTDLFPSGNTSLTWYGYNLEQGYYTLKLKAMSYDDLSIYREITQTFLFALTVNISGPSNLNRYQFGQWDAVVSGGTSNPIFGWYIKFDGTNNWTNLYWPYQSYGRDIQTNGFTLKVVVTYNGETVYDTHHVDYSTGRKGRELLLPEKYGIAQNYPNPFNPITTIKYDLPEDSFVELLIFDLLGREVRSLIRENTDAGYKSITWDSTDNNGKPLSSGVYLYSITAKSLNSEKAYYSTKKMVLLK